MRRSVTIPLFASLGASLLLAACTPQDSPLAETPPRLKGNQVAATGRADQIALGGHGEFFDADMRRIVLTENALIAMQDDLMQRLDMPVAAVDPRIAKLLASQRLSAAERYWLRGAAIRSHLAKRDDKDGQRLALINDLLLQRSGRFRGLLLSDARLARLRELLGLAELPFIGTNYMLRCRSADVPIPPDFATGGTDWKNQGALVTNLVSPGEYAGVYTFHDPQKRGACVALPRGSGAPGSLMGIICQSATTGAACFWDNKLRSAGPGATAIGWANMTVRIRDLQDGDSLRENCTGCHTGNNVYLVMPDDPTWAKLLRRNMVGTDHGNFTLRVKGSTDASSPAGSGSTFRYVPISSQAGWTNTVNQPGCANGCHEGANPNVSAYWDSASPRPSMPPACASGGVNNCYVDPF
jgi:hypothetical protein